MDAGLIQIIKCYGCDNIIRGTINPNKWISCKRQVMSFKEAWEPVQKLLTDYTKGANVSKATFALRYPIVVEVKPSGGPTCESTFIFRMVVPLDAPEPSNADLAFDDFSMKTVLVRPFIAQNNEDEFREESIRFADTLTVVNLKFVPDSYFWVLFEESEQKKGPAQIWFEAKE